MGREIGREGGMREEEGLLHMTFNRPAAWQVCTSVDAPDAGGGHPAVGAPSACVGEVRCRCLFVCLLGDPGDNNNDNNSIV